MAGQAWEVAVESRDIIGEGPTWDVASRTLLWVDIEGRRVQRLDPASGRTWVRRLEQRVGAAVPRTSGGLALCLADGVWTAPSDEGPLTQLTAVEPEDARTRMNDAKVDRAGRLWGGTMALDGRAGAGSLYRIDPDGTLTTIAPDVSISNGLDWSPDDARMYYIDTAERRVDVLDFDLATGAALGRRPFIELDRAEGLPDGMAVDAEGGLWVALYGGWSVVHFSPEGRLERRLRLPASKVTSCAFGGPDLEELYVTSATDGLSAGALAEQPLAGSLFVLRPGIRGLPATPFGG